MQIEMNNMGELGVFALNGDLNVIKVDGVRTEFTNWFLSNPKLKNVVVDMSNVPMIDSAGLGLLIAFLKQVRERGGDLNLAGLQKRVSLVFDITRTKRIFGIFETKQEAIAAFK
jgi:anti-sigma B factor antagonist